MSNATARLSGGSVDIDAYAETESIAQALAGQGYAGEAKLIRDAVECGSTASEILMTLRYRLTELTASAILLDGLTIARVRRLIAELDNRLR